MIWGVDVAKSTALRRVAVLCLLCLVSLTTACTDAVESSSDESLDAPATSASPPDSSTTESTAAESMSTGTTAVDEAAGEVSDDPAWVFVPSGLTPELRQAAAANDRVRRFAQVDVAVVNLVSSRTSTGRTVDQLSDGFRIQLDTRAYRDRVALRELQPEIVEALEGLGSGDVLLSEASAELRRLDEGSEIVLDSGWSATVARVVPDDVFGAVEIVFADPDDLVEAGAGSVRPGLLVDFDGDAVDLESALVEANGGGGVRVFGGRGVEERDLPTPVLSPLEVKQHFGEFSFRPSVGRSVVIEDEWFEENIELRRIPIIGRVRCHRVFNDALVEVMAGLLRDGKEDLIDPSAYQGCWTPRFIGGSERLSRHSWGIAADINFGNDLDYSLGSPVHPILLKRMTDAGLVSGHSWVNTDPGHFEYVGDDGPN